jgi:hypothetical protein
MSQSDELKGIGGWLLFLILSLGVIGPIYGVYDGLGNFREAELQNPELVTLTGWRHYEIASWSIYALICILRITAATQLAFARSWNSVPFAIAVMLLCPVLLAVGDFVLMTLFLGTTVATSAATTVLADFGKQLFYAGLWTWYLLRSVRVRNTYGPRPNNSFKPKPLRGSA